ncbi:hypothetical protein JD844_011530 [Phrynosoma platyrhinos]|uniref:Ig-like domain-containing protein n=1 Tax=Phrynosoma platyrhinos TaxID=52577 RepID=A0ABQ7TIL3_PHRPL|nr:hypothetical protein JD844_011530 [Phrynosoma platyrhinos]
MKLFFGLIWTLSQVCWALEGPQSVSACLGGSVSLQCKYRRGDEESIKFWCKEESPHFCSSSHLVRTTGSEAEVMMNKTSIKDSHALHKFRVTMKNLTDADAGPYLCGIERRDFDISHQVEVIITPGTL